MIAYKKGMEQGSFPHFDCTPRDRRIDFDPRSHPETSSISLGIRKNPVVLNM